ncbi:hypothetical protein [Engelhardtia mirabilis]|uniref:Uncharacterized protein n=1 Tax=Engelhardtia mirabilis TaxID=2528011 RepID=A0A518BE87_9BACT|nr:hypothetical protein Pla133_03700 [Planctomycetes bacterium Pla133]QDU99631.1 hypothetical protein Pla86_03700 [Planctomycetes bacterium Pla86]
MTSQANDISPELRELLGDIGKQRESVLLGVTTADVDKLVRRPDGGAVGRSSGSMSAAEREVLDTRRFELAAALARSGKALVAAGVPGFEDVAVDGPAMVDPVRRDRTLRLIDLLDGGDALCGAVASGAANASTVEYLFAASIRLVARPDAQIGLAYALRAQGSADAAGRAFSNLLRVDETPAVQSYAAEGLNILGGDDGDGAISLRWLRRAAHLAPERFRPAAAWAFESIRSADAAEAHRAIQHLATFDESYIDEAKALMGRRAAARATGALTLSDEARRLAADLQSDHNTIVEEVVRALL